MNSPQIFTDLARMRGQECDRPKALATELAKVGAAVVTSTDYDTLYVWPFGTPEARVARWHAENNAGDRMIFHVGSTTTVAELPE